MDGILLDQTECPFKLQTALRVVDDLRTLEMRAAVDERVGLYGTALELAVHWSGTGLHP